MNQYILTESCTAFEPKEMEDITRGASERREILQVTIP
jgi:hypothetical protein